MNLNLQTKLAQLASKQGRDTEALVVEAVERMVNYDEWFIREVDKGIAAADRGELVEHGEVGKRITSGILANADPLDRTRNSRPHSNCGLSRKAWQQRHCPPHRHFDL